MQLEPEDGQAGPTEARHRAGPGWPQLQRRREPHNQRTGADSSRAEDRQQETQGRQEPRRQGQRDQAITRALPPHGAVKLGNGVLKLKRYAQSVSHTAT